MYCSKLSRVIYIFSRIFIIIPAKESTPDQLDSPVVHWLNAINPDLFTEQAIRYVEFTHHTIHHPSHSRYTYAYLHTNYY